MKLLLAMLGHKIVHLGQKMTPNEVSAKFSLAFRFINTKQHKNLINNSEGKETSLNTDFYRVVILLLKAVYVLF